MTTKYSIEYCIGGVLIIVALIAIWLDPFKLDINQLVISLENQTINAKVMLYDDKGGREYIGRVDKGGELYMHDLYFNAGHYYRLVVGKKTVAHIHTHKRGLVSCKGTQCEVSYEKD